MAAANLQSLHKQYQKNLDIYISVSTFGFIPDLVKWSIVLKFKKCIYMGLLLYGLTICTLNVANKSQLKDETYFLFNLIYLFSHYQALSSCILFVVLLNTDLNVFREYFDFLIYTKEGALSKIRQTVMARTLRYGIIFTRIFVYGASSSTVAIWLYGLVYTNYSSPMFNEIPYLPETSIFFYPANLLVQTAQFFVFVGGIVLNDLFVVVVVSYFKAEYDTISKLASQLDGRRIKDASVILQEIHIAHKEAFSKLNLLKKYLWHAYLHKFVGACAYLCLIIYVLRFSSAYLAVIGSSIAVLYQVFMICFIGQLNLNSAENFSETLYMTKWYEMTPENQKKLSLILMISQQNVGIETLGIEAISNNTFVTIVRAALSYAAFLYTFLN